MVVRLPTTGVAVIVAIVVTPVLKLAVGADLNETADHSRCPTRARGVADLADALSRPQVQADPVPVGRRAVEVRGQVAVGRLRDRVAAVLIRPRGADRRAGQLRQRRGRIHEVLRRQRRPLGHRDRKARVFRRRRLLVTSRQQLPHDVGADRHAGKAVRPNAVRRRCQFAGVQRSVVVGVQEDRFARLPAGHGAADAAGRHGSDGHCPGRVRRRRDRDVVGHDRVDVVHPRWHGRRVPRVGLCAHGQAVGDQRPL